MLSSISTKPLSPPSTSPSLAGSRTGAICTRSSWPAGVPVTNCADGLAAPRRMRWRTLSSAWATSWPVEDGVDRAAEADQLGAAGQRRACSTAPGTGRARGCCRAGCDRRGCRPRRSGSARPSAPPGGCAPARCRGWPAATCCATSLRSCARWRSRALRVARQVPVRGTALGRELVHGGAGEHRLGRSARRAGATTNRAIQAARAPGRQAERRRARPVTSDHRRAVRSTAASTLRSARSSVAQQRRDAGQRQRAPSRRRGRRSASGRRSAGLQGPRSSISRTFCTSSLVENGLVM